MAEIIREHGPFHGMLEGFARASFINDFEQLSEYLQWVQ